MSCNRDSRDSAIANKHVLFFFLFLSLLFPFVTLLRDVAHSTRSDRVR
ncbi:hypothetical protein FOMG_08288 [Fusarium oxysporum f. sp. melonis 26406]|uniref:Uncharacterized protein n=1 Tax=Fusarium oxysporum f. sp. melonis 26406 TaxID=1089452 RepID=X0A9U1_FUSOX|nr:hypothetical protein FOMG_08288 [Fusarium oxysporum f. sp. melonis 26406]